LSTPTTADPPPYVPIRHSGWPVRRTPMWALLALVLLAGAAVLVALSHKPSHAQQTADLNAYLKDMNAAVESCAGGVTESQQALTAVESGSQASLKTILGMVNYNAQNCSPANNESLADLTQYQVSESLASFNLQKCSDDFVTWSFDAVPVQADMASAITARNAAARSTASTALQRDRRTLDAERATIYSILRSAEHTLSDNAALPGLPS
jgi:type II secretory pathway component PulJ